MATPYTIEMQFRTRSGRRGMLHLTASDVAAEYYLDPTGASALILASEDAKITRLLYSGSPATTKTANVYLNGSDTGLVIVGAANIPTSVVPQINEETAIQVPAGSKITFKQV